FLSRGADAVGDFVDVLRQVRTDDILEEAERHFQVAIIGAPGAGKSTLITRLSGFSASGLSSALAGRRLVELHAPLTPAGLETAYQCDAVVWVQDAGLPYSDDTFDILSRRGPAFLHVVNKADLLSDESNRDLNLPYTSRAPIFTSAESSDSVRRQVVPALVDLMPELGLALARAFPIFRDEVGEREIQRVARVNAEVAVVSAIPQASLLLGPASAVADTLILTKNQTMLVLRLATMFGMQIDRGRLIELAPIVGAAFGWRTLARELVGFLPAGLGVVPKAAVAYAGTVAAGRAALWYYQTGQRMPETQLKQIYADSSARARDFARELAQRFRRAG